VQRYSNFGKTQRKKKKNCQLNVTFYFFWHGLGALTRIFNNYFVTLRPKSGKYGKKQETITAP
jgi:hypothetical protein